MADQKGDIQGLLATKVGCRVSHLFFIDNSVFFCRDNEVEWLRFQEILTKYEKPQAKLQALKNLLSYSAQVL